LPNEKVVGVRNLQRYMREIKELSSEKTNRLSGDLYWIHGAKHELFNEEEIFRKEALDQIKDFLMMHVD
jgi:alpha-beta hydrolase superfamily lysophospholipase